MNEHYVNNKELFAAMVEYIATVKEAKANQQPKPQVPKYIASCILKIATRLSGKHNYMNNSHYREEMIMDGVENCLRYIANFDPEKSNNPFAYFTQIVTNAFNRRIEKEKKEDYIKHKYTQHSNVIFGSEEVENDESPTSSMNNESISDFITSFENHMARKKQKRKKGLEKIIDEQDDENEILDDEELIDADSVDN